MVVYWVLTDPYFYLTFFVLTDHSFRNFYWTVNRNQFFETVQSWNQFIFIPVFERYHFVCIEVHLSELSLVLS